MASIKYIEVANGNKIFPVRHPSGAYGMFDKMEGKFYASATSVGFTGGFDE